ncbi:MAG: response regulator [Nitrospirota bacterium]
MNTILVADDQQAIVELLDLTLTSHGYEVISCRDGITARERIRRDRPDLVILDLMMPGLTGWDVCRWLRTNAPEEIRETPVLMLTALAGNDDRVKGLKTGADDYLAKPYALDELLHRVRSLLERSRQRRDLETAQERLKALRGEIWPLVETMSSTGNGRECREEISFLFDTLVHELNNVVVAIDGYAGLLKRDAALPDPSRAYVDQILTGTNRLTRRLEDLRVLTRNGNEAVPRTTDLAAILLEVASQSETEAREKGVDLAITAAGGPVPVEVPAAVARTILRNVVQNAVKYNVRRGRVDVGVSRDETQATVSVADTGIGIPPEALEAVFARGVRRDVAGTSGMGLGLYIVRRLTERFEIDVDLKSEEGKGSVFTLRFPLSVSSWSEPQPARPTLPAMKGEKVG